MLDSNHGSGLTGLGSRLITTLPGQFLALCLINVIFVLGILWFLEKQQEIGSVIARDVFTKCLEAALTVPGSPLHR